MLYLFYGENDYLIKKQVEELAKEFSETKLLDFSDLTREISELKSLPDVLSQQSLFAEKTLFILRDFLKNGNKKELENLLGFVQSYKQRTIDDINVVFWEEKLDQRLKIVKWLKKNAKTQEFKPLSKDKAQKWIVKSLDPQAIRKDAIEELVRLHDSNLWALHNELKKLASYVPQQEITLEDVKKLCLSSVEENIFAFTDAIAVRKKGPAAKLFANLLSQQQDPWYLFAMIVRQFRLLILMKATGSLTKTHPFVVQKTRQQVKFWELSELKEIYQKLMVIDIACKTGRGNLPTELSLLIANL